MDSMISIGQTNTLAEYMILSGANNRRPPMLDRDLHDSCKSRMELYMQNKENGRAILESVKHGPLIWPTIEENEVTRIKKHAELSATEKIQVDCDLNATDIILQGLPSDIYSLVNHHRVAKDLWQRIQLLMQGTSLTKQERECKLYDAFDKFSHIKRESLHQYHLRFTQLINDMNIYKMKLEQFQVNTKFLNSLPPEWSKFVTNVKLVKDLHTTNFDQLHAYLQQNELHTNEVRIMRERSIHLTQHYSSTHPSTPLGISYPSTPYSNDYTSSVHQDAYPQPQSIPQIEYTVSTVNKQTYLADFPQIDYGLAVHVFKKGNDPIDAINKMMSFLSTVGRQGSFVAGTSRTRANISGTSGNNSGQQRIMKCFNCQEEGPVTQTVITHNAAYQVDDLDAYDSDCDDFSTAKAVFMANLSSYGSYVLSEEKEDNNIDTEIALEKKVKELDNIVCKMGQSAQIIRPMLYDGNVIAKETNVISIADSEEILMLEEESRFKMLLKQSDLMVLKQKLYTLILTNLLLRLSKIEAPRKLSKEKVFVITTLNNDLRKFKGKDIVDNAAQVSNNTTIASGLYKLDPITLAPKNKNNRETHIYDLKHTMEQAAILREIVEQAYSLNPLDSASYSACKYVKMIQELLGYVKDTCPVIHKPSEKLVVVMPINEKNS
ncbi:hypothetical protein Tco_0367376 [Tanacetum coccineum]